MSILPSNLEADTRWVRLYAAKMEHQIAAAFDLFRSHGLEPIMFKGWAAARNYPANQPRFYSDIDLAVSASDFELAGALVNTASGRKLSIDLHRELRHLDRLSWADLMSDSKLVSFRSGNVRIPSPEDHLRLLCVHWLNDGGNRKERLWDIYYAVERRPADFDWDKCLKRASSNRRKWIACSVLLAHKYLGLSLEGLPPEITDRHLPLWVYGTVEKEWNSQPHASRSLAATIGQEGFYARLRSRIPPNPIQATIENEGDLFNGSRFMYQLQSMRKRALPSLRGVWSNLSKRPK